MAAPLAGFAQDALDRSRSDAAERAFAAWSASLTDAVAEDDARLTFASEAAFAASARSVLADDVHLGPLAARFEPAFPHLYSSALFSWYTPDEQVRARAQASLSSAPQDPLQLLAVLYEQSIPTGVRKRFGQFYTPRPIVSALLDNVGFTGAATLDARLIDPAAGAGAFLIEATRRVLDAARDEGLSAAETCQTLQRVIHGLDINPLGILLTEAAIALLMTPLLVQAGDAADIEPLHLYVTDTLRSGELETETETHAGGAYAIKNRTGSYEAGFTHVVANPPYAKYPSRLLSDAQKRRFAASTYGHPNLYGLFMQVGVELLADGGWLSFITPKSFVSGQYFRNLRRFLTEHLDLRRFDMFDKRTDVFEGVLQEFIILTAAKSAGQSETIRLREFAGSPHNPPLKDIDVDAKSVLLSEDFDWAYFVSPDPLAHRVLAKMTADSRPLGSYGFKVVTGTIVWNRVKEHVRNEPAADALPLIWGKGVRMFRFVGLGNRAGESTHCALVKKTQNIISYGPALLVKRMTSREELRRVVACRVPDSLAASDAGYFAENHINIVRPERRAQLDLDAVLGLLNSRLFDYVFRALNGNTNVSATELELLPVVAGEGLAAVADAARALTASGGNDSAMTRALNAAVYELYDISADDVAELEGTAELLVA